MSKYKVNKEKCIGCGTCVHLSNGGTKLNQENKAEIVDDEKVEKAGGETICPVGAIEKVE